MCYSPTGDALSRTLWVGMGAHVSQVRLSLSRGTSRRTRRQWVDFECTPLRIYRHFQLQWPRVIRMHNSVMIWRRGPATAGMLGTCTEPEYSTFFLVFGD